MNIWNGSHAEYLLWVDDWRVPITKSYLGYGHVFCIFQHTMQVGAFEVSINQWKKSVTHQITGNWAGQIDGGWLAAGCNSQPVLKGIMGCDIRSYPHLGKCSVIIASWGSKRSSQDITERILNHDDPGWWITSGSGWWFQTFFPQDLRIVGWLNKMLERWLVGLLVGGENSSERLTGWLTNIFQGGVITTN